jgi:ACS family hexuronate transporter-like MFS transporter
MMSTPTTSLSNEQTSAAGMRWLVLAFVITATVLDYVDRQLIALVKPLLQSSFHWSDLDYANIIVAFQLASAAMCIPAGRVLDRIGLRSGYALSVGGWSLAGMSQAVVSSISGFMSARVVLGVAEAGNTPAGIKCIALWFPVNERGLAVGFFNAATNIGAILTPLVAPLLVAYVGWRGAFALTGLCGIIWVIFWLAPFGHGRGRRREEVRVAMQDRSAPAASPRQGTPFLTLLRDKRVWSFAGAKGLTDPVFWFFLFWFPALLHEKYGLGLNGFALPVAAVYLLSSVGALGGGWLTDRLITRFGDVGRVRNWMFLFSALLVVPIPLALYLRNYWALTVVVGIALAAHQCYSTNLYARAQDFFPDNSLGTVTGIGATLGMIGGSIIIEASGWILTLTHHYWPIFVYAAFAYLAGLLLMQILTPRGRPLQKAA